MLRKDKIHTIFYDSIRHTDKHKFLYSETRNIICRSRLLLFKLLIRPKYIKINRFASFYKSLFFLNLVVQTIRKHTPQCQKLHPCQTCRATIQVTCVILSSSITHEVHLSLILNLYGKIIKAGWLAKPSIGSDWQLGKHVILSSYITYEMHLSLNINLDGKNKKVVSLANPASKVSIYICI